MSYVLYFQTKSSAKPITIQSLKDYFKERSDYDLNDYRALYSNQDTGIYFSFEFIRPKPGEAVGTDNSVPVIFSVSYGKPHIFVLEAEAELGEFVRNFNLLVSDSPTAGKPFSEYNELEFYGAWNTGNEAHYLTQLKGDSKQKFYALPVQLMEKYWRWNYHVAHMQSELGREIFVPKVMLIEYQSVFHTAVVWTDGMPITLPRVEKVILYRRELVPGLHIGKKEDIAIVDLSAVEPLLKDYPKQTEHLEYYTIIYKEAPKDIKHFFQSQKAVPQGDLKFVSFSDIHDKELIEKVMKKL